MAKFCAQLLLLAATAPSASAFSSEAQVLMNPIRKVVTLLQDLQKKVAQEGEKAEELFEKYQCYCKTSGGDLSKSIQATETALAELGPAIEGASAKKSGLEKDVASHQDDRAGAKKSMADATALRTKEQGTFDKYMAEANTNVAALSKAITAVNRGMAGGFLQTRSAAVLRNFLSNSKDVMDTDRQEVMAFLSAKDGDEYAPQSGEISGILQTIHDEMTKDQKDTVATEEAAVKSFDELIAAKKKETAILSKSIESKLARVSETGIEIASMKNELGDAGESNLEDKAFLADLEKNCASKADVHDAEKKMRAEETVALADTIKILNDDDALELFKHTLPGASSSFVQVQASSKALRSKAGAVLAELRARIPAGQGRMHLDFISLALHGKKIGFEKVIKLIDDLVENLKKEQVDDESKKQYCSVEFDQAEDRKKALERSISDLEASMATTKDSIATLAEEIAALKDGIVALDKSVAEATEQRKEENAEYKDLMANNGAAKELILFAKNRLQKFYNPKMHKAAPKVELSAEDSIFVNQGGTPPPTEAPGGIADTGISVSFMQLSKRDAPAPPPATMEAYASKTEESNGVMAMMDLLVKDLQKEMTEAEAEEKAAQQNYEKMMSDSADKRATDSKSLNDKEGSKADLQGALEESEGSHSATSQEHMANDKYLGELHAECDWLLQYFDVRKQARADEIDSLGKAKAVLNGADFALVQRNSVARARKFLRH